MNITILIGETGCGKSSIIRGILSAQNHESASNVAVGASAQSCTDQPLLIRLADGSYLMDTAGTNDSRGLDDHNMLSAPIRLIEEESKFEGAEIRVVWCCNANERATANLQKQAEFINSIFSLSNDGTNGWNSVMVVVKRGSSELDCEATCIAAAKHGCRGDAHLDERVILADVLDWGAQTKRRKILVKRALESTREDRRELGEYLECDLIEEVSAMIASMPLFSLRLRHDRCRKCLMEGDGRFFVSGCHGTPTPTHRSPSMKHASSLFVHPALMRVHGGSRQKNYKDVSASVRSGTEQYHSGEPVPRSTTGAVFAGIFSLGISTAVRASNGRSKFYWGCCGGGAGSTGCATRDTYRDSSTRVETAATCSDCGGEWGDSGCQMRCTDCRQVKGSMGCQEICSMCNVDVSQAKGARLGCLHACCGQLQGGEPCAERCADCKSFLPCRNLVCRGKHCVEPVIN